MEKNRDTLHLLPITADDFETIASWFPRKEDLVKVVGNSFFHPLDREAFNQYFILNASTKKKRLCYKLQEKHTQSVFGMINFTRIDWKSDMGHIGMVAINPAMRNKGIGTIMMQKGLELGFVELGFNRIELVVVEDNTRAFDFYVKKFGFQNEGLVREIFKVEDEYLSWFSLSLLKREWLASNLTDTSRIPVIPVE